MNLARVFTAAAACVVLGAVAAACSGSFGSGTGLPNTLSSPGFGGPSTPAPPPKEASVILTYGESTAFQSLTDVGGYGGAVAFPKAPEPTPAPSPKAKKNAKDATPEPAPTAVSIAIGATLSIVKPQDGPDLNFESGKGRHKRNRDHPARALAYITLLPTHDATLESYPRFALDIPRDIASQYRDGEFGLALWNSGEKDSRYRLAVAELDTTSTPPPAPRPAVTAAVNPSPGASVKPGSSMAPLAATSTPRPTTAPVAPNAPIGSPGPGGSIVPSVAPTLPPQRILFAATASTLKLVANRPAVFALYALPHPSATPVPKASVAPAAAGSARPSASGSSSAPSAAPSGSPSPAAGKSP